jgi:hypothetical protein
MTDHPEINPNDCTLLPPFTPEHMVPALVVTDPVNVLIVTHALAQFADDYVEVAHRLTKHPDCTDASAFVHISNMLTMTERVTAMVETISVAVPVTDTQEN